MSGGSFNYVCHRTIEEFVQSDSARDDLEQMANALAQLGYAADVARKTGALLVLIHQFKVRADVLIEQLAPVWRAMEWWRSADSTEEYFKQALLRYREQCPSSLYPDGSMSPGERAALLRRIASGIPAPPLFCPAQDQEQP